jgi:hypothetical protein
MKVKGINIKVLDDSSEYQFEGYLSTYGNTDRDGDVMVKGAFDDSLKKKSTVPMLWNHDRNSVIGKLELSSDSVGLAAKGFLNLNDEKARNVLDLLRMSALDSMSVGFIINDYIPVDEKRPYGGWEITKAEVVEGSIVTIPANDKAVIQNVKNLEGKDGEKELKEIIKSAVREAFEEKQKREELIKILENGVKQK